MSRFRKADIVQRYEDGRVYPAVNVKVHKSLWDEPLPLYGEPEMVPQFSHAWIQENIDAHVLEDVWSDACERAWEVIQSDAEKVFGAGVKVSSSGRSNGWAIVDGLPDIDSWDAIRLGKWAKWCGYARAQADDIPYQMLWDIYYNIYLEVTTLAEDIADIAY